jgi:AcrR family transcriptional regulator
MGEARDGRLGRGEAARARVLAAALDVLGDVGSAGFSIEAVARRARASKATLYRHWPSSRDLLVDAMDQTFQPFPPPATGGLETDLAVLLDQQRAMLDGVFPRLMAAFIDAAERDPELAARHADLTRQRRAPMLDVLERARDRGEIASDVDLELIADLLVGPMFYNRFIAHRAIPAATSVQVVRHVLDAVAASGPR